MAKAKLNILRGKVLVEHGKVQNCRCCPTAVKCQFCSDATSDLTPKKVLVTLTGIDSCSCAALFKSYIGLTAGFEIADAFTVDPNNAWTLPQVDGNPCLWQLNVPCTGVVKAWDGTDCTGSVYFSDAITSFTVEFEVAVDSYRVQARYNVANPTNPAGFVGMDAFYFLAGDTDCPGSLGPDYNTLTQCDDDATPPPYGNNYYGGTATVEPTT